MKKLSDTEAESKKTVVYRKACIYIRNAIFIPPNDKMMVMFYKKYVILKTLQYSLENICVEVFFINKKKPQQKYFPVLKNIYFEEHLRTAASKISYLTLLSV